jgi:hypothetical protein
MVLYGYSISCTKSPTGYRYGTGYYTRYAIQLWCCQYRTVAVEYGHRRYIYQLLLIEPYIARPPIRAVPDAVGGRLVALAPCLRIGIS